MSTLATTYLKDRATSAQLLTTSVIKGAAKAWCLVAQAGTQAVTAAFNVASVTDGGVGASSAALTAKLVAQGVASGTAPITFGVVSVNNDVIGTMTIINFTSNTAVPLDGYPMACLFGDLA